MDLSNDGLWQHQHQQQPTTNNQQPTTNHQQPPTTNNQQPTTNHQQPTTNHQPPTTNNQQPTTNHQPPTTNHQPPTTNHQPPTNNKQQTTNNKQQTTNNNQQPTTNNQQQQQQQVHILTDIKVRWSFIISLHPWWGDDGFLCMFGSLLLQLVQVTLRLLTDYNMLHALFPRNQNYSTLLLWLFIANAILHDSNLRVWYFLYVKTTILWYTWIPFNSAVSAWSGHIWSWSKWPVAPEVGLRCSCTWHWQNRSIHLAGHRNRSDYRFPQTKTMLDSKNEWSTEAPTIATEWQELISEVLSLSFATLSSEERARLDSGAENLSSKRIKEHRLSCVRVNWINHHNNILPHITAIQRTKAGVIFPIPVKNKHWTLVLR